MEHDGTHDSTQAKMKGVGEIPMKEAKKKFLEADLDRNGTLDSKELATLMATLGIVLSRRQLEATMCDLDSDGDGVISMREFLEWSQGAQVCDALESGLAGDGEDGDPEAEENDDAELLNSGAGGGAGGNGRVPLLHDPQ